MAAFPTERVDLKYPWEALPPSCEGIISGDPDISGIGLVLYVFIQTTWVLFCFFYFLHLTSRSCTKNPQIDARLARNIASLREILSKDPCPLTWIGRRIAFREVNSRVRGVYKLTLLAELLCITSDTQTVAGVAFLVISLGSTKMSIYHLRIAMELSLCGTTQQICALAAFGALYQHNKTTSNPEPCVERSTSIPFRTGERPPHCLVRTREWEASRHDTLTFTDPNPFAFNNGAGLLRISLVTLYLLLTITVGIRYITRFFAWYPTNTCISSLEHTAHIFLAAWYILHPLVLLLWLWAMDLRTAKRAVQAAFCAWLMMGHASRVFCVIMDFVELRVVAKGSELDWGFGQVLAVLGLAAPFYAFWEKLLGYYNILQQGEVEGKVGKVGSAKGVGRG